MTGRRGTRAGARWLLRLLFVMVWLILIFTPCLALLLASRGEFRISTGPAPEEELRLWLVQDAGRAGLALSRAFSYESDGRRCIQTDAGFLLWRRPRNEEDSATSYCSCYDLQDVEYGRPRAGPCVTGVGAGDD